MPEMNVLRLVVRQFRCCVCVPSFHWFERPVVPPVPITKCEMGICDICSVHGNVAIATCVGKRACVCLCMCAHCNQYVVVFHKNEDRIGGGGVYAIAPARRTPQIEDTHHFLRSQAAVGIPHKSHTKYIFSNYRFGAADKFKGRPRRRTSVAYFDTKYIYVEPLLWRARRDRPRK